jgi:type I restriction enzyme S subunit
MTFNQECVGKYFSLSKGLGYLGKYLSSSDVGLIGLNSFDEGGSYKHGGEKEYSGPFKPEHIARPGDLFISTTDITQDGRVLASPMLLPDLSAEFSTVIFSGDIVKVVPRLDGLLPEFLYNILRVKSYRDRAAYASTGTTVRRIPVVVIEQLEVPVPPLEIQNAINKIIGFIDEKIKLNSRMSTQLEELAQTIFRSWFIDFDPVKAKMAGEKPVGMDEATAALFPDSMEDSELGPIPKGWDLRSIDSFGKVVTGKTPSTKNDEYWGEEIPFVTIPDIHDQRLIINTKRFLSKKGADSQRSQYLPKGSTLVSCIATPGLVAYATELCQSNQQINSVIPNDEHPSSWLYWHLRNMIPAFVNRSGIGTVFPNLKKSDFSGIQSIVPTKEIRFSYAGLVDPFLCKMESLHREAQTLVSLRDALLPRLISGELKVPVEMLVS